MGCTAPAKPAPPPGVTGYREAGVDMPEIHWDEPLCGEGADCFRLGVDGDGNAYIAVVGQEVRHLTDSREALRSFIRNIKAGKADRLL